MKHEWKALAYGGFFLICPLTVRAQRTCQAEQIVTFGVRSIHRLVILKQDLGNPGSGKVLNNASLSALVEGGRKVTVGQLLTTSIELPVHWQSGIGPGRVSWNLYEHSDMPGWGYRTDCPRVVFTVTD